MQIAIFILQVLYFGSGGIELYIYTGQMAMGIRMNVNVHHLFHTLAIKSPSVNTILATPVLIRIRCCALKRLELAKKTIVLHKERVNIERRASYTI